MKRLGAWQTTKYNKISQFCHDIITRTFCGGGGDLELTQQGFVGCKKNTICYNSDMVYHIKNKKGFTLAEVLITLGIIGVVAAMTMPSLINNYKDK